jgi:hypothetical protein
MCQFRLEVLVFIFPFLGYFLLLFLLAANCLISRKAHFYSLIRGRSTLLDPLF